MTSAFLKREHNVDLFEQPCLLPSNLRLRLTSLATLVGSLSSLNATSLHFNLRPSNSCSSSLSSRVKWLYGMAFLLFLPVKTGVGGKAMLSDYVCRENVSPSDRLRDQSQL